MMSAKMAKRYEAAWNQLFYERNDWLQKQIINEPHGRHAGELVRDAAHIAENMEIEFSVPASGAK